MERLVVQRTYPTALATTLAAAGNYSDGTPAGTGSWLGDVGHNYKSNPSYATFGTILDLSSTNKGTANTMSWMVSLLHRRDYINATDETILANEFWNEPMSPCRVDLLDNTDDDGTCVIGAEMTSFVSIRDDEGLTRNAAKKAAKLNIANQGEFITGVGSNWLEILSNKALLGGRKFDTIVVDGILDARDDDNALPTHMMDLVLDKVVGYLKPGGLLLVVGKGPEEALYDEPGSVFTTIMSTLDAIKSLDGVVPKHNLPASWIHRTLSTQLNLNVFSSDIIYNEYEYDDFASKIADANAWLTESTFIEPETKSLFENLLARYDEEAEEATYYGAIYAGGNNYVIAAESSAEGGRLMPSMPKPMEYREKEQYYADRDPEVEEMVSTPLKSGEVMKLTWANGDDYDGLSYRVGAESKMRKSIVGYLEKLGLWDIIQETMYDNPLPEDSTRFHRLPSPYDPTRTMTWGIKRPENYDGSGSDMHWFDAGCEFAMEDSYRALAEAGFDEVVDAIGKFMNYTEMNVISLGILAVTKADKGYIHQDFEGSTGRAFNFLYKLNAPESYTTPELTVIEEDTLGNRRRGQLKYGDDFGVLNGDMAMHASNECNYRPTREIRISASIFMTEINDASQKVIQEHDDWYFPFGHHPWIRAQKGRHWHKDGGRSLHTDTGRAPLKVEDQIEGCAERIGENKEKCFEHTLERQKCWKSCGAFMDDVDYRPGEARKEVFGY